AHEINNPLQAVMGFTELLIDSERRPEVREDLLQIRTDAGRAAKIVHSLLLFARRETLERSVADLNEIVRSTVALRAFDYCTRQLALRQDLSSEVPLIVANRAQIQQVLVNLLLNAEQAVRASSLPGTVIVRTGCLNGAAFVDVSDSGPGVPADAAGKVF